MASHHVDPLLELQAFVARYPTQKAAADALQISGCYLHDLLTSGRPVSQTILAKLGLERIVTFVKAS